MKMLKKLYTILVGNIERIQITDEEVEAEIKLQDEMEAAENSEETEDEDNLENEEE